MAGPFRSVSGGGDSYMDFHLDYPQKAQAEKASPDKCDHPGCWGPCGKCGEHVHENDHGRFCPNCGRV